MDRLNRIIEEICGMDMGIRLVIEDGCYPVVVIGDRVVLLDNDEKVEKVVAYIEEHYYRAFDNRGDGIID